MKLNGNKKKSDKKKKRRTHPFLIVLLSLGIVAMAGGAYLKLTGGGIKPPDPAVVTPDLTEDSASPAPPPSGGTAQNINSQFKDGFYTIILGGTDLDDYHTDSLMLAALDTKNHKLHVVNIPRDTQVQYAKGKIRKINAAWGVGGIEELQKELASLIGFAPSSYAVVSLKGFGPLVDAVGGVDFDVPQNMNYDDDYQNLHIHLNKGMQHLDGDKAIQLVRFRRYTEGDIKRIEVQQNFLKAVAKQTLQLGNLFKLNEFADIAKKYLKTNLSTGEIIWFGTELMKLSEDDITFYTLPGDVGAYYKKENYVLLYKKQALELINATINPYKKDIENVTMPQVRDDK